MKTSSTNLRQVERYLSNKLSLGERLVFVARIIIDHDLRQTLALHRQTLLLVKAYTRKQQKKQLNAIHQELLNQPTPEFQQVLTLFSK